MAAQECMRRVNGASGRGDGARGTEVGRKNDVKGDFRRGVETRGRGTRCKRGVKAGCRRGMCRRWVHARVETLGAGAGCRGG